LLTSSEETERRLLWAALIAGSALSLIVSYRVLTLSLVLGSVEGRWVYGYLQRFPRLNSRIAVLLVLGTTLIHDALGTAMLRFATP
jgi:hypothetical protein